MNKKHRADGCLPSPNWVGLSTWCLTLIFCVFIFLPHSVFAATACQVNYKIPNQWSNGFSGDVTLTNKGDAWKT